MNVSRRTVKLLDESEFSLAKLLARARSHNNQEKILLSFDLALGVPDHLWQRIKRVRRWKECNTFLDWLSDLDTETEFWIETKSSQQWSPERPFISVPPGKGSLTAFREVAGHDLLRDIDRRCGAKSPLIVSGIPGSVGSGTRSFWKELTPLLPRRCFGVWPFDGDLADILRNHPIALAENYPAISYTAVFADALPSPKFRLAKTKPEVRRRALARLDRVSWIRQHKIRLPDLGSSQASEDHFDALMAGLAQLRLLLEAIPLTDPLESDPIAEGGIMVSNAIQFDEKSVVPSWSQVQ